MSLSGLIVVESGALGSHDGIATGLDYGTTKHSDFLPATAVFANVVSTA